jgi:hypothetical protein
LFLENKINFSIEQYDTRIFNGLEKNIYINKVNIRLTRQVSNNMLFMKKIKQNIFKGHLEIQKQ